MRNSLSSRTYLVCSIGVIYFKATYFSRHLIKRVGKSKFKAVIYTFYLMAKLMKAQIFLQFRGKQLKKPLSCQLIRLYLQQ
jgi:hypothetical protein